MTLKCREHTVLRQIGVILDLIGDQRFEADTHCFLEHSECEIRHADVPRKPTPLGLCEYPECFSKWHFGLWPMYQEDVHIVEAKRFTTKPITPILYTNNA